jgi:hypothetical protein
VIGGNENLISWGYFTRFWVRMPVCFVCENGKQKRSFSLPSFAPQRSRLWLHSPELDGFIFAETGENIAIRAACLAKRVNITEILRLSSESSC